MEGKEIGDLTAGSVVVSAPHTHLQRPGGDQNITTREIAPVVLLHPAGRPTREQES